MNNSMCGNIGGLGLSAQTVVLERRHIFVAVVVFDVDRHVVELGRREEVLLPHIFNIVIVINLLDVLI